MIIEPAYLESVKLHLKVFYNEEDANITELIEASIIYIYKQLLLKEVPVSTDLITSPNINRAIKHLVASWFQNPDSNIETRYSTTTTRLVEQILGSERGY